MNVNLYRPQFNKMDPTEKQALMENLAVRYDMAFLEHGSRAAGIHRPHAGRPGAGGALLGAGTAG